METAIMVLIALITGLAVSPFTKFQFKVGYVSGCMVGYLSGWMQCAKLFIKFKSVKVKEIE
jgi:hypothetical protein